VKEVRGKQRRTLLANPRDHHGNCKCSITVALSTQLQISIVVSVGCHDIGMRDAASSTCPGRLTLGAGSSVFTKSLADSDGPSREKYMVAAGSPQHNNRKESG